MVAMALSVLGDNLGRAYDIGCSFCATIMKSLLADDFVCKNCSFFVNAFHGYTHSYDCQVKNHPYVIKGAGIEDFETLERVFSLTNQLAPVICYTSPYRRQLFIDCLLRQLDEDKYLNMATFVYNNY